MNVMIRHMASTDQGFCTFNHPSVLSEADMQDIEEWMAIVLRGMRRRVQSVDKPTPPERESQP